MDTLNSDSRYAIASNVLFAIGLIDLLRGVLHTFFSNWAARTFAKLDLTSAREDQLAILGAFGMSNLLTGAIFILISRKAQPISEWVLLAIPSAYIAGIVGMRMSGVRRKSAFYGRYFMLAYLLVCLATFVWSRLHS